LWCGAARPEGNHDVTALRTEGVEDTILAIAGLVALGSDLAKTSRTDLRFDQLRFREDLRVGELQQQRDGSAAGV
jgi:hypothetical protein